MQRKFLKDLGITDEEIIDKIINENSADIGKAKGEVDTVQNNLKVASSEIEALKKQVSDRDVQLEELKNSNTSIDTLKEQINTLQEENKAKDEAHASEIKQIKIDNAIEKALTTANARNITAVKALLNDMDKAELSEDGTVKGLQEQIDNLVKSDETKFLFETKKEQQKFKGIKPGETGREELDEGVDLSKMTYEERAVYLEEHPEIEI